MKMKENDKTRFVVTYRDFEYKGYKEDYYDYEIPFADFVNGIRWYFDKYDVNLDGRDNSIWNSLVDLDCFDAIFDEMEEWFHDTLKEDAYEEFKEYVEEWVENDE